MVSIETFIRELPKAELHLHLEGSLAPETLGELGARHGLPTATMSVKEIAARFQYADFAGFLDAFKWVTSHLHEPDDYALITTRLIEQLARENILYAEITHSAGVILAKRQEFGPRFEAMLAAAAEASRRTGVEVRWILDGVRDFGASHVMEVAELAALYRDRGVVALGIGGTEAPGSPELFRDAYAFARRRGLHAHVHAGETVGPESIWGAIRALNAERIGHGLTTIEDPALMDYLVQERIPVEVCLTSNLETGALARLLKSPGAAPLSGHPLRTFFDRGMQVTLATDDPGMFQTSLSREYELATQTFGFLPLEIARLAETSFEAAFLEEEPKHRLLERFHQRSRELLAATEKP